MPPVGCIDPGGWLVRQVSSAWHRVRAPDEGPGPATRRLHRSVLMFMPAQHSATDVKALCVETSASVWSCQGWSSGVVQKVQL